MFLLPNEQHKRNPRILKQYFWKDYMNYLNTVRMILGSINSLEVLPFKTVFTQKFKGTLTNLS